LAIKTLLRKLGLYEAPKWGMTQIPDRELFKAIRAFQNKAGLKVDGRMKPDGETEAALHKAARKLQGLGRNGDTVLANISPAKARMLKEKGGAGAVNPRTGLLEFSTTDEKEGSYIWRTHGDGKVRPPHAERDGEKFSWGTAPEGGRPDEAPNCRCTAEDVEEEPKLDCEKILLTLEAALDRHDNLQDTILAEEDDVADTEKIIEDYLEERADIESKIWAALHPAKPSKVSIPGRLSTAAYIALLRQKLNEIDQKIGEKKTTLANQKKKLAQLEHERKNHRQTAEELDRRYQACLEKNKYPRK
jgi:peptidoglycan hydrolase-like protein with peptidoglycan-binding domain